MGYHYDPILCMNVPDSTSKAKDANKYVEAAVKMLKEGKSGTEIIFALQHMGLTPVDAANYYAGAMTETGYKYIQKDAKEADKATRMCDADEIPYSELRKDLRSAQVNDVDVYFDPDVDQAAKVNWKSIGSVTPEAAIKFANDIIKAANNAKQITAKYKGKKISY